MGRVPVDVLEEDDQQVSLELIMPLECVHADQPGLGSLLGEVHWLILNLGQLTLMIRVVELPWHLEVDGTLLRSGVGMIPLMWCSGLIISVLNSFPLD